MRHVDDWLHSLRREIPSNTLLESYLLSICNDWFDGAAELDETCGSSIAADFSGHGVQPHLLLLRETLQAKSQK